VIQESRETGKTVYIDGEEIPVRCRIDTLRGLSAHADRDELLDWVSHIPNVRRIGLHHGEKAAQLALVEHGRGRGFASAPPDGNRAPNSD
jgi:metallo-beta-lactamase family protein